MARLNHAINTMKIKIEKAGTIKKIGSEILNATKEYLNEYETFGTSEAIIWLQDDETLVVISRGSQQERIKSTMETFDIIN